MKIDIPVSFQNTPIEELDYSSFCAYLSEIGDEEKASFEKRIANTKHKVYGLYSPQKDALFSYLKKKGNDTIFSYSNEDYEILYLKGRLLANAKTPFMEKREKLQEWLRAVDSWALTDCVLKGIRLKEIEYPLWFSFAEYLVSQSQEFFVRFGVIILLSFFLTEEYIDGVFRLLSTIVTGDYYVDMAIAWLLATTFINYKDKTLFFLRNGKNLNAFIVKKSFQKARESFRISEKDKEEYALYLRRFSESGVF